MVKLVVFIVNKVFTHCLHFASKNKKKLIERVRKLYYKFFLIQIHHKFIFHTYISLFRHNVKFASNFIRECVSSSCMRAYKFNNIYVYVYCANLCGVWIFGVFINERGWLSGGGVFREIKNGYKFRFSSGPVSYRKMALQYYCTPLCTRRRSDRLQPQRSVPKIFRFPYCTPHFSQKGVIYCPSINILCKYWM